VSFEDDVERIAQFPLRSRLAGTDGSSLLLAMSGKVTRNGNGEVVVDRFDFTCRVKQRQRTSRSVSNPGFLALIGR
jgi:hypothetical protein